LFETLILLTNMYPRDSSASNLLGHYYAQLGQFDRAACVFRDAARLEPFFLNNVAWAYTHLNRLDDAKTVLEQALAHANESAPVHELLAEVAYLQHDYVAVQRELEWLTAHDPTCAYDRKAWMACLTGRLREARTFVRKFVDLHTKEGRFETAALLWLSLAEMEAICGLTEAARQDVEAAITMKRPLSRDVAHMAARILAMSGFDNEMEPLLDQCLNQFAPTHTLATALYIPAIRAARELAYGNAAAAIELLRTSEPYDSCDDGVVYLRALACLAAGRASDAEIEFQKVVDRGCSGSLFTPIAQVGRARAFRRMGDLRGSRNSYESFFDLWKDADPDVPILVAAKDEYARL
jgi:tetratricopeptide (TPR) repeat protein